MICCWFLVLSVAGDNAFGQERAPAAAAPMSPMPALGFHVANADSLHIDAARDAGASFVVTVFSWENIEPTPGYDYWETSDAALRAAAYYGVGVVARLDRPPAWARDADSPTPWDLTAYADFVRRVVARYGTELDAIILWNEPNLRLEWNDTDPSPEEYVALLRAGAEAARSVDPTLPILSAGLAFTMGGDGNLNDLDFFQRLYAAGGGAWFDGVAMHPYGFGAPPDAAPAPDRLNFRRLELHRAIMVANGDRDKPVWITEMGWRVRAPNPADRWQVVTPAQQRRYSEAAISYVAERYPWLTRMAFWQLAATGQQYGFDFWRGPAQTSPVYLALVERCRRSACARRVATTASPTVEILAPDVIVRLGDRDTLHPHWVHLHSGTMVAADSTLAQDAVSAGRQWIGEFYLSAEQLAPPSPMTGTMSLVLETMQVDQPLNSVAVNGKSIGYLSPRSYPNPTSTWITQRLEVPVALLRVGVNQLTIDVGLRNPTWQYDDWRWENMQIRHLRLLPATSLSPADAPAIGPWRSLAAPGGWIEAVRLRGARGDHGTSALWLTGNRLGQLWHLGSTANGIDDTEPVGDGRWQATSWAGDATAIRFHDVIVWQGQLIAATSEGLFARPYTDRPAASEPWQRIPNLPQDAANVLIPNEQDGNTFLYAGFETEGVWRTELTTTGTVANGTVISETAEPMIEVAWQPVGERRERVLDLAVDSEGTLYKAGMDAIYQLQQASTTWQPLPAVPSAAGSLMATRIYGNQDGDSLDATSPKPLLVARIRDRLWGWDGAAWSQFGPALPATSSTFSALANCCAAETLVGGSGVPLLSRGEEDQWWPLSLGAASSFSSTLPVTASTVPSVTGISLTGISLAGKIPDGLAPLAVSDLVRLDNHLGVASDTALVQWQATGATSLSSEDAWTIPAGLPTTVTDFVVDLEDGARWFAATPAGLFRSEDGGQTWHAISPPWFINRLHWAPATNRLYVARSRGMAWTDNPQASTVTWHEPVGYERVHTFTVMPHPTDPAQIWTGTWGNDIGVSRDGGKTMSGLGNGLATLSVLDIWWHATPGQVTVGTIEGLYRSDDGGATWFQLPGPLTEQTIYALYQGADGRLWAGAANGLWVSADYGGTWQPVELLADQAVIALGVVADADGRIYLWAGTEAMGWWYSADGGTNWSVAGLVGQSVYRVHRTGLAYAPLVAATDRGLFTADWK